MTARDVLVRGLLAGFIAGLLTFAVAHQVGEPHVETAIGLEEAGSAEHAHGGGESVAAHSDDDEGTTVSRHNQRTWGLLTGTVIVGTALGGIVALVAAGVVGRLGRLRPAQSTALVALLGFVAVSFVPFLKYPATPPAVGNGETIGHRTGVFFGYLLISLVAAVAAVWLARVLLARTGVFEAVVAGAALYVVVVVIAGQLMPTVNEIGDFPADVLWYFRRASLITLATMWASIGVLLTYFVRQLDRRAVQATARQNLAASL